jgi:hypothetical protein
MDTGRMNPVILKRWSDTHGEHYISLHRVTSDVLRFGTAYPALRQLGSVDTEYVTDELANALDTAYAAGETGILLPLREFRERNRMSAD